MPKFMVYGKTVGTKYIGTFEAKNKEDAENMAWNSDEAYISFCHACSRESEDTEIEEMFAEEAD